MKAELVAFGELKIEGERYHRDVVIDGGEIRKRDKGPSKALKGRSRHTPLSAAEQIPWGGKRLIIGTGARGHGGGLVGQPPVGRGHLARGPDDEDDLRDARRSGHRGDGPCDSQDRSEQRDDRRAKDPVQRSCSWQRGWQAVEPG